MDYESLAEYLKALAYPTRLELLDAVSVPRLIGEIKVSPQRLEEGDNPERPLARQTLQTHLDKLVAVDLVREETVEVGERTFRRYMVNPQKLYAVTEELRRVSTRHVGRGGEEATTHSLDEDNTRPAKAAAGPRLVLVHGMHEGKSFLLRPEFTTEGAWLIGRKRGLAVSLDYDPFVSSENSRIAREGERYSIEDLAGSRNGTRVNWEAVPPGRRHPLETGDVIGVGRTLLVFVPR